MLLWRMRSHDHGRSRSITTTHTAVVTIVARKYTTTRAVDATRPSSTAARYAAACYRVHSSHRRRRSSKGGGSNYRWFRFNPLPYFFFPPSYQSVSIWT